MPGTAGCVSIENMLATTRTAEVIDLSIPTTPEPVKMYEGNGGVLTHSAEFGHDPFIHRKDLYQSRETPFQANAPTPTKIFSEVVHCRYTKQCEAIRLFLISDVIMNVFLTFIIYNFFFSPCSFFFPFPFLSLRL